MALRLLLAALAILPLLAACVPPPSDTVLSAFEEDPGVPEIKAAGEIRIGIAKDLPSLGHKGRESPKHEPQSQPTGLAADVGRWVAEELGVEPRFTIASTQELLARARTGRADLVFPAIPLTEEAYRNHAFTDPYYVAHQQLLVDKTSRARGVDDLSGKKVCSALNRETEVQPGALNPDIEAVEVSDIARCGRLIASNRADAATGADIYLWSILPRLQSHEIVGDTLSTEGYAGVVEPALGFGGFVDAVIEDAVEDGRWSKSYERWIAPVSGAQPEPPSLTAEEAAALFPAGLPVQSTASRPEGPGRRRFGSGM